MQKRIDSCCSFQFVELKGVYHFGALSHQWNRPLCSETYRGRLFGRIECSLKEERTDAETEILTDWISGQNSDGYGEHFEQQPIDTEDGDLYPVVFEYAGQEVAAVHITVNDGKDIPNELIYGTIKGYTCSAPQDNKRFKT